MKRMLKRILVVLLVLILLAVAGFGMLYAGRLAGETRLFGQRMKHAGVFVMAAQIIAANSTCLAGTSPDAVSRWGLPDFDSSVSRPASVPRMPSE